MLTHGEADFDNALYGKGIETLIEDYNTDLKAITGQTRDIVLLASQTSARGDGTDTSAVQLWKASLAQPGKIICTGPKYQYGYFTDNLHMFAPGYRRLGEKYGEVFDLCGEPGKGVEALAAHDACPSHHHRLRADAGRRKPPERGTRRGPPRSTVGLRRATIARR